MKKFSQILALILSVMMVFTGAAFAEAAADSTAYTMTIYDPVFYMDDEPMLDLTGLTLDLSAAAADSGMLGIFADLYAGENFDYVTSATVQLDPTGVTGYVDGMSSTYNVDVSALAGVNPYTFVAQVPLRTMLNSFDASVFESIAFTPEMRLAAVQGMVMSVAGEPEGNVYPLAITEEQSKAVIETIAQLMDKANLQGRIGDIRDAGITFTLEGTMTAEAASTKIEAAGNIMQDGEALPYTLTYSDDMQNVDLVVEVMPGEEGPLAALVVDSAASAGEDGRTQATTTIALNADGEDLVYVTCLTEPVADSEQVDYLMNVAIPLENMALDFVLSTNTYEGGNGFYAAVLVTEGEETSGFTVEYAGEYYAEEEVPHHAGGFYCSLITPAGVYGVECGLMLMAQDADSSVWALPTEGAINLLTLTEEQQQTAMSELMNVGMSALSVLQSGVPGIASVFGLLG